MDDLNPELSPWMFLFTETLILYLHQGFLHLLVLVFLQFVLREIGFAQRKQGCKKSTVRHEYILLTQYSPH